jgi:Spy/CpxP family protein refolding chaperone
VNPRLRGAIITIALALVAGFGGVWLGRTVFDRPPHQPTLHEVIHDELHLTADQTQRIETLETNFATRRRSLELEMRAANAELASAIREEHGYGPRVTAAVERFHGAMGRLQTEMIQHVFAMREVLTPAQKETFDNTVVSALTADPQ